MILSTSPHSILPPHHIPSYPLTLFHLTPSLHSILPPHLIPSYPLTSILIQSYPFTSFHATPYPHSILSLTLLHPTLSPHFNVEVKLKNAMNELEDE